MVLLGIKGANDPLHHLIYFLGDKKIQSCFVVPVSDLNKTPVGYFGLYSSSHDVFKEMPDELIQLILFGFVAKWINILTSTGQPPFSSTSVVHKKLKQRKEEK